MSKLPFALAFLIAWLVFFAIVKRVFFYRLKKWASTSHAHWAPVVVRTLSGPTDVLIVLIGLMIFMDLMDISITPLLASLGIGSLAVALALQDSLSNFFAGLYVAIDRPVEVGQYVKLEGGQEGFVSDIGWRSTRIHTTSNTVIIIANSKLSSGVITNYDLPGREMQVPVELGVHYDSDLERVEKVSLEVANEVMRQSKAAQPGAEPKLAYTSFADSSVNLVVILWSAQFTDGTSLKHEFIKRLHARFKKEGIVIPYPTRTLITSK